MNKSLVCLSVGLCLCAGAYPALAQKASSATVAVPARNAKTVEVKDYKSFKEYVANEEANLKTKPVTTDTGPVREKLKSMGIQFDSLGSVAVSVDGKMKAYLSPDKKGVAVIDRFGGAISLFDVEGVLLKKIKMKEFPTGRIGFSRDRVFVFKGNFENPVGAIDIYDFSGKLIKTIANSGIVESFIVSHNQQWLIVSTGDQNDDLDRTFLVLYDMDGNEVWRKETIAGDHPQIRFSQDDKYVILKLPTYWKDVRNSKSGGSKWVYVFSVSDGNLISGGNYAD